MAQVARCSWVTVPIFGSLASHLSWGSGFRSNQQGRRVGPSITCAKDVMQLQTSNPVTKRLPRPQPVGTGIPLDCTLWSLKETV